MKMETVKPIPAIVETPKSFPREDPPGLGWSCSPFATFICRALVLAARAEFAAVVADVRPRAPRLCDCLCQRIPPHCSALVRDDALLLHAQVLDAQRHDVARLEEHRRR